MASHIERLVLRTRRPRSVDRSKNIGSWIDRTRSRSRSPVATWSAASSRRSASAAASRTRGRRQTSAPERLDRHRETRCTLPYRERRATGWNSLSTLVSRRRPGEAIRWRLSRPDAAVQTGRQDQWVQPRHVSRCRIGHRKRRPGRSGFARRRCRRCR